MSDKRHLLIPGAVLPPDAPAHTFQLPANLRALLSQMQPAARIDCDEDSPCMPGEVAIARAIGLPGEPGTFPWAAHESGTYGTPCAWITPCHWRVGHDHIALVPARDLELDDATSDALLASMSPYFSEDGISLRRLPAMPGVWLATGELFRGLATMSMERATGQRLTPQAFGAGNPLLRRLQNEMQMLLYTHPANDARQAKGLLPVNSFWVTGAGVLERAIAPSPEVIIENRLHHPAQQRDVAAWQNAWQEIDATSCAELLQLLRTGAHVQLTLCGERAAQTFSPAPPSLARKLKSALGMQAAWDGMDTL